VDDKQVDQIFRELCHKHHVPAELMRRMLEEERNVRHLKKRRGIIERLRIMLEKSLGVVE
jgi:hypothetical protein